MRQSLGPLNPLGKYAKWITVPPPSVVMSANLVTPYALPHRASLHTCVCSSH